MMALSSKGFSDVTRLEPAVQRPIQELQQAVLALRREQVPVVPKAPLRRKVKLLVDPVRTLGGYQYLYARTFTFQDGAVVDISVEEAAAVINASGGGGDTVTNITNIDNSGATVTNYVMNLTYVAPVI